jgi:hypothetical protein
VTGAVEAAQAAVLAALRGRADLADHVSGIFDGPPARVAFPYVAMSETVSADWSHKSGRGRELRISAVVWDDGQSAARLQRLMADVEAAIEALGPDIEGHRLVSISFLRARIVRDVGRPWAGVVQYRLRVLEQ